MSTMTITGTIHKLNESRPDITRVKVRTNVQVVDTENDVVYQPMYVDLDDVGHFTTDVPPPGVGISPDEYGFVVSAWDGREWLRWQIPAGEGTFDIADFTDTTPLPVPTPPYILIEDLNAETAARVAGDAGLGDRVAVLEEADGSGFVTIEDLDAETAARVAADAGKAALAHTHSQNDVTGLVADLGAKATSASVTAEAAARVAGDAAVGAAAADALDNETALRTAADDLLQGNLTDGLAAKAETVHGHAISEVTGLTAVLAGKATSAQGALADTAVQPADMTQAFEDFVGDLTPETLNTILEIATAIQDADLALDGLITQMATKASQAALDAEIVLARNADNLTSGTVPLGRMHGSVTLDSELAAAVAAEAALARDATNLTSGTIPDARIPSGITRDTEMTAAAAAAQAAAEATAATLATAAKVAAEATAANASNLSSGTVADARIPGSITRDSELTAAIATSEGGQVRDGDAAGGVLSGAYPNPTFAADMATQAELDAEAVLARNADNLASGTVPDARIAGTIARTSQVEGWTYQRLAADFTNATTSDNDVLAGFTPLANTSYEFECWFETDTSIQTTGIQVGIAGPTTGITRVYYAVTTPGTASTDLVGHINSLNARATPGTTVAQPARLKLEGRVHVGAVPGAGNIRPTARSETGAGATVTVYAKSYMRWRVLP